MILVSEEESPDNPVTISYTVPINESLELNITLRSHYPENADDSLFVIESWNTSAVK